MRSGVGNVLDIGQIQIEAQSRWLRPAEVCEILRNYMNFRMSQEPPNMPPSGSLFIFNRKVLRYFRKDGHNWRKKKDGKTVKETHERLKVESINVLNCNYAHGEDNEDFQRRVYWSLEEELSHIAFVHYREVKGNRTNFNRIKETEEAVPYSQETEPNSEMDSSVLSFFLPNNYQVTSQSTDTTGLNSAQALENVDTESAGNHQASSGFHPFFQLQQPMVEKFNAGLTDPSFPGPISGADFASLTEADKAKDSNDAGLEILNFPSWEDDLGNGTSGNQAVTLQPSFPETQPDTNGVLPEQEDQILGDLFYSNFDETLEFGNHPQIQNECQGNRTNFNCIKETEEAVPYSQETEPNSLMDSCVLSCFLPNNYQVTSQSTDTAGLNSAHALEHVDTESGVDFASLTQADKAKHSNNAGLEILDFSSWADDLGNATSGNQAVTSQPPFPETQPDTNGALPEQEDPMLWDLFNSNFEETLEFGNLPQIQNECQGNMTNYNLIKETEEAVPYSQENEPNFEMDSSVLSCFLPNNYQVTSQSTDTTDLNSAQALEHVNTESAGNHQASSGFHPFFKLQQPVVEKFNAGLTDTSFPGPISDDYQGNFSTISGVDFASLTEADKAKDSNNAELEILDFSSWKDDLGNGTSGNQAVTSQPSLPETQPDTNGVLPEQEDPILGDLFNSNFDETLEFWNLPQILNHCQTSEGEWPLDQNVHAESVNGVTSSFHEQDVNSVKLLNSREPFLPKTDKQDNDPMQSNLQVQLSDADHGCYLKSNPEINMALEGKTNSSFTIKKTQLDGSLMEENLKKLDSFNRWMSKELGGVNESHTQSSSEVYWDTVESENRADESNISPQVHLDNYTLGPSLSQDQLFSIIDFSPNWAYEGSEVKVLITGRFLKSQQEIENCKWSCMFGEVEVPAEVIADGVILCHTPVHKAARVPFYVTCSNRLACSEVREFEYRVSLIKDVDIIDYSGNTNDDLLMRFKNFLSLTSAGPLSTDSVVGSEKSQVSSKISSLLEGDNDEWDQMLKLASEKDFSPEKVQDVLLEKLLKEKLHVWLLQKSAEDGKGPSVVDEGGQGVLHFAAALGYDWALEPTIIAGVSVNFRDVKGWTALHWAAFCGRERTVCSLVSLGAAPGALTDPSPKYPSGRTAADLASVNGHKGIAGYLAESHLSTHLSSLKLDTGEGDAAEISGAKAVQKVSERSATPVSGWDLPYGLSLKDSLAAVCNASQAFARIYQVLRVESFNKKQLKEYGDDTFGTSDEQALSLLALKTNKSGQHDLPVHAAAIRIQNKFRSWKGRREFLIIRQQIVKIQAHVRGHQVRKNYKKFTWSVGIVEKLILRWRRKGSGLRGFKSEALTEGHRMQDKSSEDDYDFLKEGRKQTEQTLQKALARVKSMAQYPDARDQYRRLLNVVTDIQGSKVVGDGVPSSSEETADYDDEMIDCEAFLEDDTYMPSA